MLLCGVLRGKKEGREGKEMSRDGEGEGENQYEKVGKCKNASL